MEDNVLFITKPASAEGHRKKIRQSQGTSVIGHNLARISIDQMENTYLTTLKEQLVAIKEITPNDYIEEAPNKSALSFAEIIISALASYGIRAKRMSAMPDGGISFEFVTNTHFYAIEAYNSNEIVFVEQRHGEKGKVHEITKDQIRERVRKLSPYGD